MSTGDVDLITFAGPVVFAYDGSERAARAIERAGCELATDRDAIVLCVWQPADVGFEPVSARHFDADAANEVQQAADETAAFGASLARDAGFRAQGLTVHSAPTWKGITQVAVEHRATLIVLGAHRHTGLTRHFLGSVAAEVVSHATCAVLVVHDES